MSTTSQPTLPATSDSTTPAAPPEKSPVQLPTIRRNERGVQLSTYDDAVRFARVVVNSGLAPSSFKTAEQVFVAIQYGAEIGLSPMQALQSIAVINGRPSLWGDALVALVRGSGKCEFINDRFEGDGDSLRAVCKMGRDGEVIERSFSVNDAKAAGLWGKAGPWKNYPRRMLQVRARAWAIRDGFADVLCGFQSAEEQFDIPENQEPRRVIEQGPNDANYCALVSTLTGKCGCQTESDNNYAIGKVSRDFGSLADIKDNEAACGEVLKSLEGRHEEIAAELEKRRSQAAA